MQYLKSLTKNKYYVEYSKVLLFNTLIKNAKLKKKLAHFLQFCKTNIKHRSYNRTSQNLILNSEILVFTSDGAFPLEYLLHKIKMHPTCSDK